MGQDKPGWYWLGEFEFQGIVYADKWDSVQVSVGPFDTFEKAKENALDEFTFKMQRYQREVHKILITKDLV